MTDIVARALATEAKKSKSVNQYSSISEFPNVGADGALYIDNSANTVYYWNSEKLSYILLISGDQDVKEEVREVLQESIISGGTSNIEIE